MPLLNFPRLTAGLPDTWTGYLRDWDRSLRAANHPETTRYNYLLAAVQLARYLAEYSPDPDADDAAVDPTTVTRAHVEAFQAWMVETRSGVREPKTPTKLVPVLGEDDTAKLLDVCRGKDFLALRDTALIRLYRATGARLSEIGMLTLEDLDLGNESVHLHGKGAKDRRVRFGPQTARTLSRYLRVRAKHPGAQLPALWLAERGGRALQPNGIKIRLKRLGEAAGVAHVHAHRWRHSFAHEWKLTGGDTGDLMVLLGWASEDMPRHCGASAAAERAQRTQVRLGIGEQL